MKKFVFSLVCLTVLGGLTASQPVRADDSTDPAKKPPAVRRPSIILIVADDLGFGDLGCYGQGLIQTPNIDKLAAEGMKFTSFYGGAPVGVASRATLLTGKHVGHIPIRGEGKGTLSRKDRTLGELMDTTGYLNGILGEWGMGGVGSGALPLDKGFSDWAGFLDDNEARNYYPRFINRADKTHDVIRELRENDGVSAGIYIDDWFMTGAENFIRIWKPEQYRAFQPFFLYLPLNIPRVNKTLAAKTGNGMEVPEDKPYSANAWPQPEKNKAAMISRLDRYVGALREKLEGYKIDNNTLIILTSGNGPDKDGGVDPKFFHSAGDLRGHKGSVYEGGIRVPFIARWQGRIKAGTVSDIPFALYDVMPTLVEIGGGAINPDWGMDGISFATTLIRGSQTNRHESFYWESHVDGFDQAIRKGDWKAVRHGTDGAPELYNLKSDPSEKQDISAQNKEVLMSILKQMDTARTEDANWPAQKAVKIADTETKK